MIYWLNGAYGAGKTTVSRHLVELLRNGHVFDPELIGNGIQDNYPESLFFDTFEQYPLWLELNYLLLKDLYSRYDGDIVVPMTLLKRESYDRIIKRLKDDGVEVRYIYLDADEKRSSIVLSVSDGKNLTVGVFSIFPYAWLHSGRIVLLSILTLSERHPI